MPPRARKRRGETTPSVDRRVIRRRRAGDGLLELQRAAGNAVVTQMLTSGGPGEVLQRVKLTERLSPTTISRLNELGETIVQDLEAFHAVLVNPAETSKYLGQLETDVSNLVKIGVRPTRALSQALHEDEFWMAPPREEGKDYERIEVDEGIVSTETLVGHLAKRRPLKDVGAPISHGEWAHRIQLWILNRWAKENNKKAAPIYEALRIVTDKPDVVSPTDAPAVWSWVLDIPNELTRDDPKREKLEAAEVGSAAPARLTMGITQIGGQGSFDVIPGVPRIRTALLNRRLKRFVEARIKQRDLTTELRKLNETEGWALGDEALKDLTTPGSKATEAFESRRREVAGLGEWGKSKAYVTWMARQDLSLRVALSTLAKRDDAGQLLGDLKHVVENLGAPYTQPFMLVRALDYEARAKIAQALIATSSSV